MTRHRAALVVAALLALAAPGCGDDADPVVTQPQDPATGALLISIEHVGGGPRTQEFAQLPLVAVHEDGRTFTPGAMIMIYPGPAVVPVAEGRLDGSTVESLLDAARDAGLDQPRTAADFGAPASDDLPDVRITVVVDGRAVETVVPMSQAGGGPGGPGERAAIEAFVQEVTEAASGAEEGLYEPERYRVLASPYGDRPQEEGIEPNELSWPAEADLVDGSCVAVTGADAEALRAVLEDATELTRWVDGDGAAWSLAIRPVLPHESDC